MYTCFDCSFYRVRSELKKIANLVKKYGIGGICIPAEYLEVKANAIEAKEIMKSYGLKWGLMPTPVDMYSEEIDDRMFAKAVETLKLWSENAKTAGVARAYNHVHPGSNSRSFSENFEWYVERIKKVYKALSENGVQYGLEFVGPVHLKEAFKYPFIYDLNGILGLADAVDPNVGILFDTYHWYTGGGTWDDVLKMADNTKRIVAVHVNDGIKGRTRSEQLDNERAMPMTTGVIDSRKIVKEFFDNGYNGPILCEPMDPCYRRLENMETEAVVYEVAKAYECFRDMVS